MKSCAWAISAALMVSIGSASGGPYAMLSQTVERDCVLRDRVRQLRQLAHRFVAGLQVDQKDDQHADAQLSAIRHGEAGAVAEHENGANRDEDVDDRRELGLHAARRKRGLDAL